jgi:hypothetical protein
MRILFFLDLNLKLLKVFLLLFFDHFFSFLVLFILFLFDDLLFFSLRLEFHSVGFELLNSLLAFAVISLMKIMTDSMGKSNLLKQRRRFTVFALSSRSFRNLKVV